MTDVAQLQSDVLNRFRQCVMKNGKLPRPFRYGQAVALLAQLYGVYQLQLRNAGDVIPSAEFTKLERQIGKCLGSSENEQALDAEVDRAEALWNDLHPYLTIAEFGL